MIITCPNCNKKFKIDPSLIPKDGRDLKCSSCGHVWLYKVKDVDSMPLRINENNYDNEIELNEVEKESDDEFNKITKKKEEKREKKFIEKQKSISENKERNTGSKLFSYLVVFIISLVALIILLDTFKTPLTNVFPGVEIILFSLFETLHDIKLFIIDLY